MTTTVKTCPREKCFMWKEKGDLCAPGLHASLDEAMKVAIKVDEGRCGLGDNFGTTCIRVVVGMGLKIILNQMIRFALIANYLI